MLLMTCGTNYAILNVLHLVDMGGLDMNLSSLEQLIKILDHSNDGIIITDAAGNVLYVTPIADVWFAPYVFRGKNVRQLESRGAYSKSIIWEATKTKKMVTAPVRLESGKYVVSTANPILDEDGNVQYVITNSRWDNELQQHADALHAAKQEADKFKRAFDYVARTKEDSKSIVTRSEGMINLLDYLRRVSPSDSPIHIYGESGTGKELLSAFAHENSARKNEPFIPVNCAAIPKDLAESEFFGYSKGAFSGALAKGKPGFFELANGGTLFLDEVAEMPLDIQAKILRVLEDGSFRRVGGTMAIKTNVRIISATNRNLYQHVLDSLFREDLYYRLNVIPISVLPLRERQDDIVYLAENFLRRACMRLNKSLALSNRLKDALVRYDWPGNVRELKNFIERYAIIPEEEALLIESLRRSKEPATSGGRALRAKGDHGRLSLRDVREQTEIEYIEKVLQTCDGNMTAAARILGINRSMLYRKVEKYGITREVTIGSR